MRREVKDKTNVKKDANTVHQVNRVTWKIIKFYLALVYVFIVLYLAVFMLQTASSVVEIQNATKESEQYTEYKEVSAYTIDDAKVTLEYTDDSTEDFDDIQVRGVVTSDVNGKYVEDTNTLYVKLRADAGIEYVFKAKNVALLIFICVLGIVLQVFEKRGLRVPKAFTVINFILMLMTIVCYLVSVIVLNN